MNSQILHHSIRFIFILLIQVLLLKRIDLSIGSFNYAHLVLFPILIALLPLSTPRALVIILGFFSGLFVDFFYDSPGIHASALTATAFFRKYVLQILEPTEGYKVDSPINLKNMRIGWVLTYLAILFFFHLAWYFSVEAFSFVYLKEIIFRILSSFVVSFILGIIVLVIYNPKY